MLTHGIKREHGAMPWQPPLLYYGRDSSLMPLGFREGGRIEVDVKPGDLPKTTFNQFFRRESI